jgi:hypothetical protein
MAGSNSIRSDAMPSSNANPPSSNANPAALVNFIFRQLPDDVLDAIGAQRGGAYHKDTEASGVPHESVIAAVGGAAVAAGEDTVTIGLVQNVGTDHGGYSIIEGDATFEASAQAPEAGGADAAADTVLAVAGADYIIKDQSSHGGSGPNDAWASSELDFVAVNINGWSPEGGPVVYELDQPGHQVRPDGHQPPDGNYAAVIATAEAHGADTLTATQTNALTVENQFSFVNGIAVVAV